MQASWPSWGGGTVQLAQGGPAPTTETARSGSAPAPWRGAISICGVECASFRTLLVRALRRLRSRARAPHFGIGGCSSATSTQLPQTRHSPLFQPTPLSSTCLGGEPNGTGRRWRPTSVVSPPYPSPMLGWWHWRPRSSRAGGTREWKIPDFGVGGYSCTGSTPLPKTSWRVSPNAPFPNPSPHFLLSSTCSGACAGGRARAGWGGGQVEDAGAEHVRVSSPSPVHHRSSSLGEGA
jgi:hypothetical protein